MRRCEGDGEEWMGTQIGVGHDETTYWNQYRILKLPTPVVYLKFADHFTLHRAQTPGGSRANGDERPLSNTQGIFSVEGLD